MHAYALIGPSRENFSTNKLIEIIKREGVTDFHKLWPEGSEVLKIRDGQALYLYGGRKALQKALQTNLISREHTIEASHKMVLYRAQRHVGLSGTKAKQLLMLTPDNFEAGSSLANRVLFYVRFTTDWEARSLGSTIGDLPKL